MSSMNCLILGFKYIVSVELDDLIRGMKASQPEAFHYLNQNEPANHPNNQLPNGLFFFAMEDEVASASLGPCNWTYFLPVFFSS